MVFSFEYRRDFVRKLVDGEEIGSVYHYLTQMSTKKQTDHHCGLGISTVTANGDGECILVILLLIKKNLKWEISIRMTPQNLRISS